jgi:hypothetical protein
MKPCRSCCNQREIVGPRRASSSTPKILELIDNSQDEKTMRDVLGKLNRSLVGIEAHGDFTDEEFEKVLLLRNGEE